MITLTLSVASAAACAVILWRAEPALNRMTPGTHAVVRIAMWLITVGAAAQLVGIVTGIAPQWQNVVLEIGIACLLSCERRLRVLIPRPRNPATDP